jgi:hypothetical protein
LNLQNQEKDLILQQWQQESKENAQDVIDLVQSI